MVQKNKEVISKKWKEALLIFLIVFSMIFLTSYGYKSNLDYILSITGKAADASGGGDGGGDEDSQTWDMLFCPDHCFLKLVQNLIVKVKGGLKPIPPVGPGDPKYFPASRHLLISEVTFTPTQFIEIHNPSGQEVDLSGYYLTDGVPKDSRTRIYEDSPLIGGILSDMPVMPVQDPNGNAAIICENNAAATISDLLVSRGFSETQIEKYIINLKNRFKNTPYEIKPTTRPMCRSDLIYYLLDIRPEVKCELENETTTLETQNALTALTGNVIGTSCRSHFDCGNYYCDTATGICRECLRDLHCKENEEICLDFECKEDIDLSIELFINSTRPVVNKEINISILIKNLGNIQYNPDNSTIIEVKAEESQLFKQYNISTMHRLGSYLLSFTHVYTTPGLKTVSIIIDSKNTLIETNEENNAISKQITAYSLCTTDSDCSDSKICKDGMCMNRIAGCIDSDQTTYNDGKNYDQKGTAENATNFYEDSCISVEYFIEQEFVRNEEQLLEYYCDPATGAITSEVKRCDGLCLNGVCIDCVTKEDCPRQGDVCKNNKCISGCSDTDINNLFPDGFNIYTKGTIENITHAKWDFCLNNNTLVEYTCNQTNNAMMDGIINCPLCYEGKCYPCTKNEHCQTEIVKDVCNTDTNYCVECVDKNDCKEQSQKLNKDLTCNPTTGRCIQCFSEEDCSEGEYCSQESGICVNCLSNENCPEHMLCDINLGQCVDCITDKDCLQGLYCTDAKTCVECESNQDCQTGEICSLGSCVTSREPNKGYYLITKNVSHLTIEPGDFLVKFPSETKVKPGKTVIISISGSEDYVKIYGKKPDYELFEDDLAYDDVQEMIPVILEDPYSKSFIQSYLSEFSPGASKADLVPASIELYYEKETYAAAKIIIRNLGSATSETKNCNIFYSITNEADDQPKTGQLGNIILPGQEFTISISGLPIQEGENNFVFELDTSSCLEELNEENNVISQAIYIGLPSSLITGNVIAPLTGTSDRYYLSHGENGCRSPPFYLEAGDKVISSPISGLYGYPQGAPTALKKVQVKEISTGEIIIEPPAEAKGKFLSTADLSVIDTFGSTPFWGVIGMDPPECIPPATGYASWCTLEIKESGFYIVDDYIECIVPGIGTESSRVNYIARLTPSSCTSDADCPLNMICKDGRCIPQSYECTDTDMSAAYPDGKDPLTKGFTKNSTIVYEDICLKEVVENGPATENTLMEYYCDNFDVKYEFIICSSGASICSDGKCVECVTDADCTGDLVCEDNKCVPTCTDTDMSPDFLDGDDPFTAGIATNLSISYNDICSNATLLIEYYCEDSDIISKDYPCVSCKDGSCVECLQNEDCEIYEVCQDFRCINSTKISPLRPILPPSLSPDSETLVLFFWDNVSALVKDVDYTQWGTRSESIDKTGIKMQDQVYPRDTAVPLQALLSPLKIELTPDLAPVSIEFVPPYPLPETFVTAKVTIRNLGGVAADPIKYPAVPGINELFYSIKNEEVGNSEQTGKINQILTSGEDAVIYIQNIPVKAGTNIFTFVADNYNFLREADEKNNNLSQTLLVSGSAITGAAVIEPPATEECTEENCYIKSSFSRICDIGEPSERYFIGAGITGHDETGENIVMSFIKTSPTPHTPCRYFIPEDLDKEVSRILEEAGLTSTNLDNYFLYMLREALVSTAIANYQEMPEITATIENGQLVLSKPTGEITRLDLAQTNIITSLATTDIQSYYDSLYQTPNTDIETLAGELKLYGFKLDDPQISQDYASLIEENLISLGNNINKVNKDYLNFESSFKEAINEVGRYSTPTEIIYTYLAEIRDARDSATKDKLETLKDTAELIYSELTSKIKEYEANPSTELAIFLEQLFLRIKNLNQEINRLASSITSPSKSDSCPSVQNLVDFGDAGSTQQAAERVENEMEQSFNKLRYRLEQISGKGTTLQEAINKLTQLKTELTNSLQTSSDIQTLNQQIIIINSQLNEIQTLAKDAATSYNEWVDAIEGVQQTGGITSFITEISSSEIKRQNSIFKAENVDQSKRMYAALEPLGQIIYALTNLQAALASKYVLVRETNSYEINKEIKAIFEDEIIGVRWGQYRQVPAYRNRELCPTPCANLSLECSDTECKINGGCREGYCLLDGTGPVDNIIKEEEEVRVAEGIEKVMPTLCEQSDKCNPETNIVVEAVENVTPLKLVVGSCPPGQVINSITGQCSNCDPKTNRGCTEGYVCNPYTYKCIPTA